MTRGLEELERNGLLERMKVPEGCTTTRTCIISSCAASRSAPSSSPSWPSAISAPSSTIFPCTPPPPASNMAVLPGEDRYTTALSERLLRLPMFYELSQADCTRVIEAIYAFFAR